MKLTVALLVSTIESVPQKRKKAKIQPAIVLPSNSSITNTKEMAEYVLTGQFTVSMATDYGCNGRGTFDPFSPSLGSRLDFTDGAFAKWKQCIQCASGNDAKNVSTYNYDPISDTCGKFH